MARRFVVTAAFFCCIASGPAANAANQTGRAWLYGAINAVLSDNVSYLLMPGFRLEYAREGGKAKGLYMTELVTGPALTERFGDFAVKLGLWYYYSGYPVRASGAYFNNHSIDLVPTLEYRLGSWTFANRLMLHGTVYADCYKTPSLRRGFSVLLRNLLSAKYALTPTLAVLAGEEPFIGVVKDGEAPERPDGFFPHGWRYNRASLGVEYRFSSTVSLTSTYILEASLKQGGGVAEWGHYGFFSLMWMPRLGQPPS
jgi:hypothetical protein